MGSHNMRSFYAPCPYIKVLAWNWFTRNETCCQLCNNDYGCVL